MNKPIDLDNPPKNIFLEGRAADKIAICFGTDTPLPVAIPVWVADYLENNVSAGELRQLRSTNSDGGAPQYADLTNGKSALASQLFFRGDDYRSPELMEMRDRFGVCKKFAQVVKTKS